MLNMTQCDLNEKKVILRVDLNVPMENGKILNESKIISIIPTLKLAIEKNAKILLLSHLGRPKEGSFSSEFSLEPIAKRLQDYLNYPVRFEPNYLNGINLATGEIVLGENVRFNVGEEKNDKKLAQKLASLCDVFVMDAFASAHRAHASTVGIAEFAPIAVAGPLLLKEIETLKQIMTNPKRPLVAIVGGAKISSKIPLLKSLLKKIDVLIVGGGIANMLCLANGQDIGASIVEKDLLDEARNILEFAKERGVGIILPEDMVVAESLSENVTPRTTFITEIKPTEKIFDVGPKTLELYRHVLKDAGTILWNGPLGVFENKNFATGTNEIGKMIAESSAFSVAGGGETLAAIEKFGLQDNISYLSTGGGAFLEYIEGKILPAVAILEKRAA